MEREFRESIDTRPSAVGLAIVLGVAAILRFWAIGTGIPYALGADEPQIMNRAVAIMRTGDFNPHFFDYPGLYIYVQMAVACVQFVLGASAGAWSSLREIGADNFYFWGRIVTATLGVATVYLVYQIGSRWGSRHALLAAGLLAVMPNHVRESHYVLTDVPVAFFVTLSFLLTLRALEKETVTSFAWAGAAAGLAAATKYYGGIVLIAPFVAVFFVSGTFTARVRMAVALLVAAIAGFLVAAPYTVLDLPGFLNGFAAMANGMRGRPENLPVGWITYLKHLQIGLAASGEGWARATAYGAMALLVWGLVHAIVRVITGPGKGRFAILVVFPLVYFAAISNHLQLYARYLMPILPFVAVLIAIAVVSGVTLSRRFSVPRAARTAAIAILTVVAILPPAIASIRWDAAFGRTTTYDRAYAWIRANLPAKAAVVVETGQFALPAPYRCLNVPRLIIKDYDAYVRDGFGYAVLSGQSSGGVFDAPDSNPEQTAAYRRMLARMSLMQAFKRTRRDMGPDLWIYKFADDGGPQNPAVVDTSRVVK